MLCQEFEDKLTDYVDGLLAADSACACAEHALRCPVCHELLSEVKHALLVCRTSDVPVAPDARLEARILMATMPDALMSCAQFEDCLTDYLDGFLPAPLFHRWERHALTCDNCADLPGQVVRSIGACYTYIDEQLELPAGLHARILQQTLGTTEVRQIKPSASARLAEWLRGLLDPIVSPQFATVATMLLVAVLVLTNTISSNGTIEGMYRATIRLAEQAYSQNVSGPHSEQDHPAVQDGSGTGQPVKFDSPAAPKQGPEGRQQKSRAKSGR